MRLYMDSSLLVCQQNSVIKVDTDHSEKSQVLLLSLLSLLYHYHYFCYFFVIIVSVFLVRGPIIPEESPFGSFLTWELKE